MHPYLSTAIAKQHQIDIVRSVERMRLVREVDAPTAVDAIRLIVGRTLVRFGRVIAGRRGWALEPRPAAPAATAALNLAR